MMQLKNDANYVKDGLSFRFLAKVGKSGLKTAIGEFTLAGGKVLTISYVYFTKKLTPSETHPLFDHVYFNLGDSTWYWKE